VQLLSDAHHFARSAQSDLTVIGADVGGQDGVMCGNPKHG